MPREIYFDEAGFTGSNLTNYEQPYFSYCGLEIAEVEAEEIVNQIRNKFGISADELKGSSIIKQSQGKDIAEYVINTCGHKAKVLVANKKYALACHFFECMVEPFIADKNKLFYELGFHKFVANLIYLDYFTKNKHAEELLLQFECFVRKNSADALFEVCSSNHNDSSVNPSTRDLMNYCLANKKKIEAEIKDYHEDRLVKWHLDLTLTALASLLIEFGANATPMKVFCDDSKPLNDHKNFFDIMIGKKEKLYLELGGEQHQVTFNLHESINFIDSKQSKSVQLADILASTCSYLFRNRDENWAKHTILRANEEGILSRYSILPDFDHVDLERPPAMLNVLILKELLDRSQAGENLLFEIEYFIKEARRYLEA